MREIDLLLTQSCFLAIFFDVVMSSQLPAGHPVMKGKNSKQVCKRPRDKSATGDGGQAESGADCTSQRKKTKMTQEVKDQKNTRKEGPKKVTLASTSVNPNSSSVGSIAIKPENQAVKLTTFEIEQMQHIESVMDEVKHVPDITELIKDSDTSKIPGDLDCSWSSAPPMVSEGQAGRFQTVNFYWLDMFEEPDNPGVLFIFGKVKSPPPGKGYSSCFIVVNNLQRRVLLLPKETKADGIPVDYMDVYNEFFTVIAPQYKLPQFQCERSKRKFCFNIEGIPPEAEYMEVRYSGIAPALPEDVKGETFSLAFGTNTSLLKTFLLEKKLKGPCWLQLSYCERVPPDQQQSWGKFEFTCDVSSVKIHPEGPEFPTPTLVLASLKTQFVYDSKLKRDAFIFAGVVVHGNFSLQAPPPTNEICHDYFCLINTPPGQTWPKGFERITNKRILKMDSESSMLECLVNKLHEIDVDIYLDYGVYLSGLLNQLSNLKVPNWSKVGRWKRSMPLRVPVTEANLRSVIPGRLFVEMMEAGIYQSTWNLADLDKEMEERDLSGRQLAESEMKALYKSCEGLQSFVKWGMKHCVLNILEMNRFKVLPLVFQKSCIVGDTLARMLSGTLNLPTKYILRHALSDKDYIVPDNRKYLDQNFKKAADVNVEFVLELGSGNAFYDNHVLQLIYDEEWLYCFTLQEYQFFLSNDADPGTEEPRRSIQNELWKLGESQKQIKCLMGMRDLPEDQMREYEVRLEALQAVTCEVMFGAVHDWLFRNAMLAYMKGQVLDMLLKVKEIVSKMGYEVIYASESSMMVQTHSVNMDKALEIEKKLKEEIQQTFPLFVGCIYAVEIYRCLLLLKDNKYAGLVHRPYDGSKYFLDLEHFVKYPRSEVPIIVSETASACLHEILSEQPLCDKIYKVGKVLWDVGRRLRDGSLPFEELSICKTLTKDPEEYKNVQELHHVTVALRMNKRKTLKDKLRKGHQVSYVICADGRPRHFSDMKSKKGEETKLRADADYYLAQMIHPAITEICEKIPGLGLDSARVADALGLSGCSF